MDGKVYIKKVLNKYDIRCDDSMCERLNIWCDALLERNKEFNLTSIENFEQVVIKHVLDSVVLNNYFDLSNKKIADIGSGSGAPGILLAIADPAIKLTSIESSDKKAGFQLDLINMLKLDNVKVVSKRVEDIGRDDVSRETFDVCASRAVGDLRVLCEYALPLLKIGGIFIAYKGPEPEEEINNANNALQELCGKIEKTEKYEIEEIKRSLIFIKKTAPTPSKYPRKAGIPAKRPL